MQALVVVCITREFQRIQEKIPGTSGKNAREKGRKLV